MLPGQAAFTRYLPLTIIMGLIIVIATAFTNDNRSARDARISALEKRIAALEASGAQRSTARQKMLEDCFWNVNETTVIDLSEGRIKITGRSYPISSSTIDAATKIKQQQIEECNILYGK